MKYFVKVEIEGKTLTHHKRFYIHFTTEERTPCHQCLRSNLPVVSRSLINQGGSGPLFRDPRVGGQPRGLKNFYYFSWPGAEFRIWHIVTCLKHYSTTTPPHHPSRTRGDDQDTRGRGDRRIQGENHGHQRCAVTFFLCFFSPANYFQSCRILT